MARKILTNIKHLMWYGIGTEVINNDDFTDDLNIVPTLKVILDYINDENELTKTQIAGLSGAAFFIGWNAETLLSGMGGSIYQFPKKNEVGIHNLFDTVGRSCEIIRQIEEGFNDKIVQSIDRGIPVFAVEWFPIGRRGHNAIIAGYDTSKNVFYGRIYDFIKVEEYVELNPEELHFVIIIGNKSKNVIPMKRAVISSVSNAIELLTRGIVDVSQDEEKLACGMQAYEHHAEMVKNLVPTDEMYGLQEHFIFWQLEVLYQARLYAQAYLEGCLKFVPQSKRDSFSAASLVYKEFISYFESKLRIIFTEEAKKQKTNLLWLTEDEEVPLYKLMESEKGRNEFSQFLLGLMMIEKKGVEKLKHI